MNRWISGLAFALGACAPLGAEVVEVSGRVVDRDGRPVAGAEVSRSWAAQDSEFRALRPATTGDDGRFTYEAEFSAARPTALLALDRDRKAGGLVLLDRKAPPGSAEIVAAPLVRLRGKYSCTELGKAPGWTNTMLMLPGNVPVAVCMSTAGAFDLPLPPGEYQLIGFGKYDEVGDVRRPVTLPVGQAEVDLGTIDLKAAPLARLFGKEPPPLTVTDARGAPKSVTLADYRGRWVLLDFWGYWCGPCIAGMPALIDLCDEYRDVRDRFEILAFHHGEGVESIADLDPKMAPIIEKWWRGRPLPFPILVDSTGATIKDWGIESFPTTLLIDPEGHLVRPEGRAEEALIAKLPPRPIAERISRALDRDVSLNVSAGPGLEATLGYLGRAARIPIALDAAAIVAAGIAPDVEVPLDLAAQLSLRSWLDLILTPVGLTVVADADGLLVTPRTAGNGALLEPADRQRAKGEQIARESLAKPVTFDLRDASFRALLDACEEATGESFALDPIARKAGTLDASRRLAGKADGVPVGEALRAVLGPLGLTYAVRDEAVLITPK